MGIIGVLVFLVPLVFLRHLSKPPPQSTPLRLAFQYLLCMLYLFGRRLGYSFQRVRNVQVLPFIYSQRVIGQHFNLFNVVQRGYKCTQAVQILVVIGNRRHKNVPYPDGFANFRQVSCTVQNVVVGCRKATNRYISSVL